MSTNLEPLRDDRGCDELVGGHLLVQLVVSVLVEQHQVVELVPGVAIMGTRNKT